MSDWKQILTHTVNDIENHFDSLKYRLRERLGGRAPIMILPYRGYGIPEKMFLKGRVLEDKGIQSPQDNDSIWDNLANMYKRFDSSEIPYAKVRVRFQDVDQVVTADEEGFFEAWIQPIQPVENDQEWQDIELDLVEPLREGYPAVHAAGQVQIPPPAAQFGVISDIDDTVVKTDATHVLRMARTVFLGNARTRLPFKGVAAFYRALYEGKNGNARNPLFFVSSSPWNLYDLFSDFFHIQGIPGGPLLFLRDWGITENELLQTNNQPFKTQVLEKILNLYTSMPFILIGDSGQQDPEIYEEVVRMYPGRILAVYIRNVSRNLERPEAIRKLAAKLVENGSTLILADDTLPLAKHAIEKGWISPNAFPEIHAEKKADEAPPSPVERILGEEEKSQTPTVVIDSDHPETTEKAVDQGAIENALDSNGKPPNIVVKSKEETDK